MNKKYTHAIYIGRFQGFHLGQKHNIDHGLNIAEKLIIIVGSGNKPIDWKNPWTAQQRIQMIKDSLSPEQLQNIHFQVIEDRLYQNSEWEALIYDAVDSILMQYSKYRLNSFKEENRPKIALIGCDKDDTTWYLKCFPNWKQEFTEAFVGEDKETPLSSTAIRTILFDPPEYADLEPAIPTELRLESLKNRMPMGALKYVLNWTNTDEAKYVAEWYLMDKKYQEPYESLPYGTNFYCADNVVIHSGHVLLIKRKFHPGKGLWALPGGHVGKNETAYEASIRELYEETNIKVPEKIVRANFFDEKLFDHPERSLRGRVGKKVGRTVSISHCYSLDGGDGLPRVKASDDAEEAWWFNFGEIKKMRGEMFEDHLDQIQYWLAKLDDKK